MGLPLFRGVGSGLLKSGFEAVYQWIDAFCLGF
jgi:hypothetical protein